MKLLRLFCCLLSIFLVSCSMYASKNDRDVSQAYLKESMRLPGDMFLVETKKWNQLDMGRTWVFYVPMKTYYNNYVDTLIPSYGEYQADTRKWRRWSGDSFSGWTRIDGIIAKGTAFHIEDIAPNGYSGNKNYWVTVEFDEGAYQGRTVLFGNPRSIIPRMYL